MTPWSAYFPDVLAHVPGAPDPIVEQSLCRAAREFFRRTRSWVQWLEPLTVQASQSAEYDFEVPDQAEVVRLERATRGGAALQVAAFRELEVDPATVGVTTPSMVSSDLRVFRLTGGSGTSVGEQVQAQVSLMPTPTATGLPDEIALRYLEPIVAGGRAVMLMIRSTTWHDPKAAAVARAEFESLIAQLAVSTFMSNTNVVPRARARWV